MLPAKLNCLSGVLAILLPLMPISALQAESVGMKLLPITATKAKENTTKPKRKASSSRYGPDGDLFLDPYIVPYLQDLKGKRVLDAGCGINPYSIHAAKSGAHVNAIDIQPKILEIAKETVSDAEVQDLFTLEIGDVSELQFPDNHFDLALSINVGSHLPSTTEIQMIGGRTKKTGLGPHIKELARVTKPDGKVILTAPASMEIVFTKGGDHKVVSKQIMDSLARIGSSDDISLIKNELKKIDSVNRATFAYRHGHLELITDESELIPGEEIWRKIPDYAISNRYHSEEEYKKAILDAGFTIEKIERPYFKTEALRKAHNEKSDPNSRLGKEYRFNHPFVIFYLTKADK